ncbi:hypothetical protein HispidOSU_030252, partial [Sigmodon hispidus]
GWLQPQQQTGERLSKPRISKVTDFKEKCNSKCAITKGQRTAALAQLTQERALE